MTAGKPDTPQPSQRAGRTGPGASLLRRHTDRTLAGDGPDGRKLGRGRRWTARIVRKGCQPVDPKVRTMALP